MEKKKKQKKTIAFETIEHVPAIGSQKQKPTNRWNEWAGRQASERRVFLFTCAAWMHFP